MELVKFITTYILLNLVFDIPIKRKCNVLA